MSICKSCPKKLLAIEGGVGGGVEEETPSSCLVRQRWSQQQEMAEAEAEAEVLWGQSSSKSKRQRKLLNEIFALKFCQVSCARLPSVRTSWLRSPSRSSSSCRGSTEAAVYRSSPTHSRTSVLSRSLVTDSKQTSRGRQIPLEQQTAAKQWSSGALWPLRMPGLAYPAMLRMLGMLLLLPLLLLMMQASRINTAHHPLFLSGSWQKFRFNVSASVAVEKRKELN